MNEREESVFILPKTLVLLLFTWTDGRFYADDDSMLLAVTLLLSYCDSYVNDWPRELQ